ncbi:Cell surface glycoprotein 1 [Talaromyces islandicus]|uniref:Cell surface glycoprotein 1 n=1 Tax=Talaromyces islandicus TaxID=28573 RepID=A0A0U1LW40_TALIS|nr:Cell surface glycoprotein 1 [Talaromyces islandicus]
MSQYPPGSANYAPQWPAQPPQNSNDQPGSAFYGINAPLPAGNFATMPFNPNPSTQLPGLGMTNGLVPPPYFSRNFHDSQMSVPFGAQLNGAAAYPLDNSLSTPPFGVPQPPNTFQPLTSHPASRSHGKSHPPTQNDTDREEGEVSDFSGNDTASQHGQPSVRSKLLSRPHADEPLPPPSTTLLPMPTNDDYESASIPLSDKNQSREGSESPYNPPMTITALPEVSEESSHISSEAHLQDDPTKKRLPGTSPIAGKTVSQIRVMAQGALLGLVPHNIRFNELAKENIDPDILRQLYNEIGIKITNTVSDVNSPEKSDSIAPVVMSKEPTNNGLGQAITTLEQQDAITKSTPQQKEECSSVDGTSKPLERKELIARMLAAKANKVPTSTAPKSTGSTPRPTSAMDQSTVLPGDTAVSPKISQATQPKEKNKAQTELARQRIEQLKKMGLKRQQSQPEKVSTLQAPSTDSTPQVATLSHPLPERPPVSEHPTSSSEVPTPQIPGLSMKVSEVKSSSVPADIGKTEMDIGTPIKNVAKRPRASDFDETFPKSKKPSVVQDRLVIDISDDESMEDQDDALMLGIHNDTPSSQTSNLPLSSGPSYQRSSASATPQSRLHDAESLRQKDLEIQAMRRRIAEFEEKKKAKKSNPTASTISPSGSFKATSEQDDATQSQAEEEPLAPIAATLARPKSTNVSISSHTCDSNLDQMRQRLLRKQEIECGLPALDDEILRIEAKLAESRRLEEELMAQIAKSREGRKQLVDELESIVLETQEMEALQEVQDAQATEVTSKSQDNDSSANITTSQDPLLESMEVSIKQPLSQTEPIKHDSPCAVSGSLEAGGENDTVESESTTSEASDSSMSESSDNSERESTELGPESESEQHVPQLQPSNDVPLVQEASADAISAVERPVLQDSTTAAGPSEEASGLHESTKIPDDEPLEVGGSADEAYSPKLGEIGDEEEMDTSSVSSSSHGDADMRLTPKFQEQVVMASKNDALDNAPDRGNTILKFSPYESPLKYFRGYRYHPNFDKEVGDSYRSLTYSHKINPAQALCPYESAGGVCNDNTCEFQHWRDMVMPDDKILVEMGNQREGETPEEKEKFLEGLKVIINTMQRDQVKDFTTVASEIAAYRRRFLSDPTRILPL